MNIRALATQVIWGVLANGRSLSTLLTDAKNKCQHAEERAFLQALVFGVLRWYLRLAFISQQLLQKPIKSKEIELHYLIVVGLYQLIGMHVPAHAAIAETVEAARVLHKPWATGLVNAVLRSYQRQSEILQKQILSQEEAFYAHPKWFIDAVRSAWPQEWQAILEANNTFPPLSLRVNLQKCTRQEYLERLAEQKILAQPIHYTTSGINLDTPVDVTILPGFTSGIFSVQDGAAQLTPSLLALQPQLRILDACAAPGGKTTHILESEPNLGEVLALDISPERTQKIQENLRRLQLKATVVTGDASKPTTWWDGRPFDRILLDAPCSATGVIRRHPDIKSQRKLSDITKLAQQQLQLLNSLWPLLKPGGILLYVTCSILPEENWQVMQTFLDQTKNAYIIPFPLSYGKPQIVGQQLLPGQNNMDGFYYGRIGKRLS